MLTISAFQTDTLVGADSDRGELPGEDFSEIGNFNVAGVCYSRENLKFTVALRKCSPLARCLRPSKLSHLSTRPVRPLFKFICLGSTPVQHLLFGPSPWWLFRSFRRHNLYRSWQGASWSASDLKLGSVP